MSQPRRRDSGTPGGSSGRASAPSAGPSSPPTGDGREATTRGASYRHTCHAVGCPVEVPPARFMCRPHWFSLPAVLRVRILRAFDRKQLEPGGFPSVEWMIAAHEARAIIAENESRPGVAEFQWAQAAIWEAKRTPGGK